MFYQQRPAPSLTSQIPLNPNLKSHTWAPETFWFPKESWGTVGFKAQFLQKSFVQHSRRSNIIYNILLMNQNTNSNTHNTKAAGYWNNNKARNTLSPLVFSSHKMFLIFKSWINWHVTGWPNHKPNIQNTNLQLFFLYI